MAHQTLPNILLSNASMVTKSCIARFVDDDAFNPCALRNCSTGPSPRWRTESRPCRHSRPTPAVYGPAYLAAFAQFPNKRLIAVGKFEASAFKWYASFVLSPPTPSNEPCRAAAPLSVALGSSLVNIRWLWHCTVEMCFNWHINGISDS